MAVSPAGRRPAGRRLWRSPRCAGLASAVPVPFAARPAAAGWLCLPRGRTPPMAFTALCGFGKRCPRPVCRASRCGGVVVSPAGPDAVCGVHRVVLSWQAPSPSRLPRVPLRRGGRAPSAGQAPVCRYASMLPAGSAAMSPAGQAAVRSCVSRRFARVRAAPAAPSQPAPFPDRPTGGKTHPS